VQVIGSTLLLVGMVFVVYLLSQKMRA
jgi:hypothetical protein